MTDPITRARILAVLTDCAEELPGPPELIRECQRIRDRLLYDAPFEGGPFAIYTDAGLRIVDSQGRTVG